MRFAKARFGVFLICALIVTVSTAIPVASHPGIQLFRNSWPPAHFEEWHYQDSAWNAPGEGPAQFRTAISWGDHQWEQIAGGTLTIHTSHLRRPDFPDPLDPCNQNPPGHEANNPEESTVAVGDVQLIPDAPSSATAGTAVCERDGSPAFFSIIFDNGVNWHTRLSAVNNLDHSCQQERNPDPDPEEFACANSNEVDLASVAAHEFGHAAGWGDHYVASDGSFDHDESDNPSEHGHGPICWVNRPPGEDDHHYRQTLCPVTPPGQVRTRTLERHDKHTYLTVYHPPFLSFECDNSGDCDEIPSNVAP